MVAVHFVFLFFFVLKQQWWHGIAVFTLTPEEPTKVKKNVLIKHAKQFTFMSTQSVFPTGQSGSGGIHHEPAEVSWFPNA